MSEFRTQALGGWAKVRPIRVAFFIEQTAHTDLALDAIFANCYSRWGGRFSLIVPCVDGRPAADYWPWLETFDPDVVYSYARLSPQAVLLIHERLCPADYVEHRFQEGGELNAGYFRPRYHDSQLSSLSTVFRLARHSPLREGPRIKILDSWHTEKPTRFMTDNFGYYRSSGSSGFYPNDAKTTAGLLTVVSEESFSNRRLGIPRDLDRIDTERAALSEFVAKRATSVGILSSLYATRLEIQDRAWGTAFNLVIGDTVEDRLLFWNARLLIPTWLDSDMCCLRITLEQIRDDELMKLIAHLLNTRNHVNNGSGGQPQLIVRSASHSEAELTDALACLRAAKVWSATGPVVVVPGGHVIPKADALEHAREQAEAVGLPRWKTNWHAFRWQPPVAHPPALEPEHLADAPPGQHFTLGLWALDLSFEYAGDAPRSSQENVWMLPKRWRMASAFQLESASNGFASALVALSRTTRYGNLAAFAAVDRSLVSVTVPTIEDAMYLALCRDSAVMRVGPNDPPWPTAKARWIRPSNESPHLKGVLGMTGSLSSASRLLLHPFLKEMFALLGGAPNLADADTQATVNSLIARARRRSTFDLMSDPDRAALACLIVKAAQSIKAPKMYVSYEDLLKRWKVYREQFWSQRAEEASALQADSDDWAAREERSLDQSLVAFRKRRMLFQGYPWTCRTCQHRNWADVQTLRSTLTCEVCLTEADLPVSVPWYFRPNEFLIESLRSRSVLSLIWLLTALRDRARSSFMYLGPTWLGYSNVYDKPDAEADVMAVVDGEAILCEVKSAWRSLRSVHVTDFVELAKRLRPDHAILAIMEEGNHLKRHLAEAEAELLSDGIKFSLLTPASFAVNDGPMFLGG